MYTDLIHVYWYQSNCNSVLVIFWQRFPFYFPIYSQSSKHHLQFVFRAAYVILNVDYLYKQCIVFVVSIFEVIFTILY